MTVKALPPAVCAEMRLDRLTENYCKRFAARLKSRREVAGLSINRLSEMAGVSQSMMSYLEQEKSLPSLATLFRIAHALGTTPDELLKDL